MQMKKDNTLRGLVPIGMTSLVSVFLWMACGTKSGDASADSVGFAFVIAGITFLAAFVGGALPLFSKLDFGHRMLEALTSISAGFLISAACLIVIPEGFERYWNHTQSTESNPHNHENHRETNHENHEMNREIDHENRHENHENHRHENHREAGFGSTVIAGLAILLGFILMLLTESLGSCHDIHEEHHDQDGGHVHHPILPGRKRLAVVVVVGLTIHAIADGMAIGAGLATGSHALTGSLVATLLTHKVPAAFSLSMFSQHAHGSLRRTWRDLLIFSAATPLAIIATWAVLGTLSDQILGLVLLFSAGTFIYVATIDVLPKVLQSNRRRQAALQVMLGCVSLLLLILLLDALGFSLHDHG